MTLGRLILVLKGRPQDFPGRGWDVTWNTICSAWVDISLAVILSSMLILFSPVFKKMTRISVRA